MRANGSHVMAGLAFLAAAAVTGCASRIDQSEHRRVPEQTAAARSDAAETLAGRAGSGISSSASDPREYRTPDGRPAPYGRDPVTGRALGDPPPAVVTPAAASRRPKAGGQSQVVVVQKGDTLSALARRYSVGVDDLKRANALRTDSIREGQRLNIPRA
jgi:nucleoid-associated protein YgaU